MLLYSVIFQIQCFEYPTKTRLMSKKSRKKNTNKSNATEPSRPVDK